MPKGIQNFGARFRGINILGIVIGSARSVEKMEKEVISYSENYRHCIGATTMVPNCNGYHIFSPNSGRDWYAVDEHDRIVGTAEQVYPGLVAHLDALELLKKEVENGPINPASLEGKLLLEAAGFRVTSKSDV